MMVPKSSTLSPARLAANRRNALKSTGPKTAAGKRRVALNGRPAGTLCSPELERQLRARGEDPRDFRRLHCDLIALFRPDDGPEKDGVETLARVWWDKARRIRGWVGIGDPRCDDLDARLDALIRALVLKQSSQHRWWKVRLHAVLGYGLQSPDEVRLRIERRLFAFGGRPGKRSYPSEPSREKPGSPVAADLRQTIAEVMGCLGASLSGVGNQDDLNQVMAEVMGVIAGERGRRPSTEIPSQG